MFPRLRRPRLPAFSSSPTVLRDQEVHATPQPPVETPQPITFPPAKSPLALINSAVAPKQQPVAAIPARPSKVRFSGSLANRELKTAQPIQLAAKSTTQLLPTIFLVGVTDRGEVRHIFLQAASGDKTIDQQAEAHLAKIEFAHAPEPMTWGFATCFWGNDASSLQPSTPAPQP